MIALFFLAALGLCALSCSDRRHRNPLDPLTTSPEFTVDLLQVQAGDGRVVLRWDYSQFDDISGFQLYRRDAAGDFVLRTPLTGDAVEFVDTDVENGTTYDYRLALLVQEEGEILIDHFFRATPGEEVCWVGDVGSGAIWRISPDGRSAQFGKSGFFGLRGVGLDLRDGALWVASSLFSGLFRIDADGTQEIAEFPAAMGAPALLAVAPETGIAWIVDSESGQVVWTELSAGEDSLRLQTVDANFSEPAALAAIGDVCWIADPRDGRVLRAGRVAGSRLEFADLEGPSALAARDETEAWALVAEGRALVRLTETGPPLGVDLSFTATAIDADTETGECWVIGDADLAVFSSTGGLIRHEVELSGGRSLRLDPVHRTAWLGGLGRLTKLDQEGRALSQLGGFSQPDLVQVDPRGGSR